MIIKAESHLLGTDETLEIGEQYYFGQLWNGDGGDETGEELLESGQTTVWEIVRIEGEYNTETEYIDHICEFEIVEKAENVQDSIVLIKGFC